MAGDGVDTFPDLLSVYRTSVPKNNSISQNSVPNIWRTSNIIEKLKLKLVTRVTNKSNSMSPEDKSNTPQSVLTPTLEEEEEELNSPTGVDATTSEKSIETYDDIDSDTGERSHDDKIVNEDLDDFNRHSGDKPNLEFEMKSYQEMVEREIKQTDDSPPKEEHIKSQVSADSSCESSEKLNLGPEENHVDRQNKEMDVAENSFQDQIQVIEQTVSAKGDQFVKFEEKEKDKEIMQLVSEREKIMRNHEEKWLALKKKQWQELVELEKELENELAQLTDKYTSDIN
ncbi:protein SUPPRESSOR OF GENE SILENCING 3-like isoform X2 [Vigna unguiculata]|uniref:protein SUPPRESSOR OF GENE SILENCING 3-like isoform X2 n=1 Tax=Vigna unguiculata TaxID=3917 RepID=UPI001016BE4C|nr:protein SUPPRESSOR OF GENE SILENCING 3-like isoform X2 [Vigna unguiculata]